MAKKHVQIPQLYFADQVGVGTVNADGVFKIENVLSKTEIKFRYSMAVSAEEAANNIKYKTATKKAGTDWKNYINLLKVHFAPYPGTTVFPKDAEEYNKKQEEKFMNKAVVGNENANAIENANVQKEEENNMTTIIINNGFDSLMVSGLVARFICSHLMNPKTVEIGILDFTIDGIAYHATPGATTLKCNGQVIEHESAWWAAEDCDDFDQCMESINDFLSRFNKTVCCGKKSFTHNFAERYEYYGAPESAVNNTAKAYVKEAEAAATNPVPSFVDTVMNLMEKEDNLMENLFEENIDKQETTEQIKTDAVENKTTSNAPKKEEDNMMNENVEFAMNVAKEKGLVISQAYAEWMAKQPDWKPFSFMEIDNGIDAEKRNRQLVYDSLKRAIVTNVMKGTPAKGILMVSNVALEEILAWIDEDVLQRESYDSYLSVEKTAQFFAALTKGNITGSNDLKEISVPFMNDIIQVVGMPDGIGGIIVEYVDVVKAIVNQPAAVENKAPESADANKKEEETMSNNPYDAIAVMKPAFNPYLTVRFNVIQGGKKVPQERSITCLSMQDRMKLAAEGKVKPMKLESPTYYTGSLFNGNKKVGTWAWNTVRWAYPSLTLNTADGKKKTYSFNGTDHDKPLDNVSILLMAMVQVIGTVRGVKSTVKYYPRKKANGAPRSVTGTAKPTAPAQTPAVEATPSVEEDVAFFMN